ncbi:glutathione S-transferase T3-like [Brachypodium distachyon]|uniref:Myb-like domain-containing protein n=1 Tax=Brachypodium distachyon TaxID=15368 RepID=A0A0Q3J4F9_BRADI|nr:glutathione S-transferase T3-like [Brachypodium distachyon]KQJ93232.1 hypothetical protein BRADI_3g03311v3 [Brachypodium distachyon]|eukprot:XP_024316450.1 glutathione S-transferase T3-like [Brachypodium distachyon]
MAFFGVAGGNGSRDEDNSPVGGSGTPHSVAHRVEDPANNEEGSESSPDEQVKRGKGKNWSKKGDELLVSAWLNNSNDPIDGNSKKSDHLWKQIAKEYNMYAPQDQQKSAAQCKNHWTKNTSKVPKFNACYNELKSTYPGGQSEDQLMEKVREKYKVVAKMKRPFPLEHWWKMVKKQPKWRRLYTLEQMNKRNKLDTAGAYSSSNQETEAEEETKRPQGQKAAKAQRKGKSKCSTGTLSNENVEQFNNLQLRKSITAEKMATAALLYAENEKERIEAEKEKTKVAKLDKYFNLIEKGTSNFTNDEKLGHERILD